MKRPAAVVALVYASGLLLAECVPLPFTPLCALALTVLVTALVWNRARPWLVWPLVALAGATNLVWHQAVFSPYDLRATQGERAEIVTIRGVLAETPSQRIYLQGDREISRSLAQVEVTHIRRDGTHWQPAVGEVLVLTPGVLPEGYYSGQTVEISGVLAPPPGPVAEGLFDYRAYLRRHQVYYQLKADSPEDWRRLSPDQAPPLSDRFLAWAQATLARGLPVQDEALHLLWAMTLGWKTGLTNEIYEPFMRSGTMHIFAISGLHIALIAGILVSLLRVLQVSRAWCGGVTIPLIWFYTAATGWQPSAIRSTIMMSVIIGGWALRRPTDLLNSLAASAVVILVWDPQQLFGASFQLSFFVVLSIGLLLPPIERVRDRLLRTDPLLPPELVPTWRRWVGAGLRWPSSALATSLAAWLGSLPLTAYYFHLFSPVTLLANLVIVPLSSAALACNLGSLVCGSWLPWATECFNASAWFWMQSMLQLSHWAATAPYACLHWPAPSLTQMAVYYVLLVGILSGWLLAPGRRRWTCAALALAVVATWGQAQWSRRSTHLTVLPLSGGMGVYVRAQDPAADLLIDCGASNAVRFTTSPFLRAQGVNRLPTLLLSHGDLRHVGGAILLAELFPLKHVCASPLRVRSRVYRDALTLFGRTHGRVRPLALKDTLNGWTVLHPAPEDRLARADDQAVVLRGTFNGTRVLLLSDLGRSGQSALLERETDLRAEILVTGLPADGEALCDALLEVVQPQVIVVADSEFPATERASPNLRQRLALRHIPVFYTRAAGAATIDLGPSGWSLRTMTGGRLGYAPPPRGSSIEH